MKIGTRVRAARDERHATNINDLLTGRFNYWGEPRSVRVREGDRGLVVGMSTVALTVLLTTGRLVWSWDGDWDEEGDE